MCTPKLIARKFHSLEEEADFDENDMDEEAGTIHEPHGSGAMTEDDKKVGRALPKTPGPSGDKFMKLVNPYQNARQALKSGMLLNSLERVRQRPQPKKYDTKTNKTAVGVGLPGYPTADMPPSITKFKS